MFLPKKNQVFLPSVGRKFEDTPVINAIRKWGPVQLLVAQDGKQAEPIQHLVQHLGEKNGLVVLTRNR